MVLLTDYVRTQNKKSLIVATVHDSIVLDVHPDEIQEMAYVTKFVMENLPVDFLYFDYEGENRRYPVEADIEIGHNYNDLVDYDPEDYKTFNSPTGYIKYLRDLSMLEDHEESDKITEEQLEEGIAIVEGQKDHYRQM